MDLLAKGSAWLARTRTKFASRCITYARGGSSITVRATPGRTTREIQDSGGFYTTVEIRDELIQVCDLVIDGAKTEPLPGDQIMEGVGSDAVIWKVAPPTVGEPAWRYTDAYRQEYRIHLQIVQKLSD